MHPTPLSLSLSLFSCSLSIFHVPFFLMFSLSEGFMFSFVHFFCFTGSCVICLLFCCFLRPLFFWPVVLFATQLEALLFAREDHPSLVICPLSPVHWTYSRVRTKTCHHYIFPNRDKSIQSKKQLDFFDNEKQSKTMLRVNSCRFSDNFVIALGENTETRQCGGEPSVRMVD